MTPTEYIQLRNPRLSHPARTLYYLHLRRQAGSGAPVILSYPELGRALAVEDPQQPGGFAYQVNASQLTRLLDELLNIGLLEVVHRPQPEHYHGAELRLPALTPSVMMTPLPQQAHAGTPLLAWVVPGEAVQPLIAHVCAQGRCCLLRLWAWQGRVV